LLQQRRPILQPHRQPLPRPRPQTTPCPPPNHLLLKKHRQHSHRRTMKRHRPTRHAASITTAASVSTAARTTIPAAAVAEVGIANKLEHPGWDVAKSDSGLTGFFEEQAHSDFVLSFMQDFKSV
jgi:hypothetical protein